MMKIKTILVIFGAFMAMAFYEPVHKNAYPDYVPKPLYDIHHLDSHQVLLGRVLFYDPQLSADGTISCASCHSPYNAFAHTDHDLSHGIDDQIGDRNAPALFNLAWQPSYMWDGAIRHIEMQALAPLTDKKEMGTDLKTLLDKLQASTMYRELFYKAFRDSIISSKQLLKAFAAFQLSLISFEAKYDKVKKGLDSFSVQEQSGYQLFRTHCNSCHREPLFSEYSFKNNGLAVDTTLNDFGLFRQTGLSRDSLLFKVPSLRNLSYSYPYMHDGRFRKLRTVINHYSSLKNNPQLSEELKQPIVLDDRQKVDLIAFLKTLNDKDFVFNPKLQYPRKILLKTQK